MKRTGAVGAQIFKDAKTAQKTEIEHRNFCISFRNKGAIDEIRHSLDNNNGEGFFLEEGILALKETIRELQNLLTGVARDLEKSLLGNQSAAQRVRTQTILLAKIAKRYRKESLLEQKKKIIR